MSAQIEEGTARASLGENNFLTEQNNHAVVGLGAETKWHVKAYNITDDSPPLFMILMTGKGSEEERCLTLDTNQGENENNIMLESPEMPRPKTSQLWTFEEAIMLKRLPPIMLARVQSVARPWLSAAVGGNVPLPKIYQNIAGVPNDPGSESQRWNFDYMREE
ncbi:uncharacterized protein H6S33_007250 [Morchella sextelata]|uniref:uncharacterized protein n=1 Tax=Morchella sextelata TaxID=1174677 RepID=UPI001D04CB07|nr:uncharacterized protein H6S33_007250 [Morchella sextelata]KAH0604219.1 hypothetical protein H6S33_007250 [Morchella sextelata]